MSIFKLFIKTQKETLPPAYQVGQEWYYHTRPGEENSTLKILKIEDYEQYGTIVHIAFTGVCIRNSKYTNGVLEQVLHLPVTENALRNSTTRLKNDRVSLPDYEFGYVRWKTAFDEEKAGYFDIPLRVVIQWLEDGTYEVKQ